jgi:hypothetical protein
MGTCVMLNFHEWILSEEITRQSFYNLAYAQRDLPEKAMLRFQMASGGGVMNYVIEHVGDLTHRMSEQATFPYAGYEYVRDKVKHSLMYLTNPYGFNKEFQENLVNNAQYLNVDPVEFKQKMYQFLDAYANEHEKLPVFNKAQQTAQAAAVSLGRRKFPTTVNCLKLLESHLISREEWVKFAHEGLAE